MKSAAETQKAKDEGLDWSWRWHFKTLAWIYVVLGLLYVVLRLAVSPQALHKRAGA